MTQSKENLQRAVLLFAAISCLLGAANSLGEANYANYFKEVYQVTAQQRGFIEVPRELPGVLTMLLISLFGSMSNIAIAVVAQLLACAGMLVMGVFSPPYAVMLFFVFVHSLGQHVFMTLKEAIGMELAPAGEVGRTLGRFRRWWNLSACGASLLVFVGFQTGFFSFGGRIIRPFVLSGLLIAAAVLLLILLLRCAPKSQSKPVRRLVVRRRYLPYYLITLAFGCQKRIRLVFAPWVVVELLRRGAQTVALLSIITSFVAMWAAPAIGKLLDGVGVRKTLVFEGCYMLAVFLCFGALVQGFAVGAASAAVIAAAYLMVVLSSLIEQFNMVHSFLVRELADDPNEVTATLSTGLSLDHVVATAASSLFGVVWLQWGAQWVFYLSAVAALVQLVVAAGLPKQAAGQ